MGDEPLTLVRTIFISVGTFFIGYVIGNIYGYMEGIEEWDNEKPISGKDVFLPRRDK